MRRAAPFLAAVTIAFSQDFTQRGFLETRAVVFPQAAAGDSGRVVGDTLLRYEASYKLTPELRFSGAFEARADTHHQTERRWDLAWQDRSRQRPAFATRRLSASWRRGRFTAEAGKQFIRWGKADIVNPTDRFAPRDFLSVVDNDFLAVTAARLTWETGPGDFEMVYAPRFTPSRIPLLGQRWVVLPPGLPADLRLSEARPRLPGGPQFGVRWNHAGAGFEYAFCYYEGFNHLPLLDVRPLSIAPPRLEIERFYPRLRLYGGEAAVPLRWFTIKGEAAYFSSSTLQADEYVLYVIQIERQAGEWSLVGGYAGEATVTRRNTLDFSPERGLVSALIGRAGYTIDASRSLAVEGVVRQSGSGSLLKLEYSQAFGQHFRATAGFSWIRGSLDDFLGQYRRNSHAILTVRYSF